MGRWPLRYETTDVDVAYDGETASNDYAILLPSAHLLWNVSESDRVNLSLGRSVRSPNFNFILPLEPEEEYRDNNFVRRQSTARSGDRVGHRSWLRTSSRPCQHCRVNIFYRDVKELIEVVNSGAPSATAVDEYGDEEFLDEYPGATRDSPDYSQFDPDSLVYSAANVGDGHVYRIEFDASTSLTAFGMENTGVFVNCSWLDSSVEDEFGERTFNDPSVHVYNVGFIQDLPEACASVGISHHRQGTALSRLLAEEATTRCGADFEAFVEKRFGENRSVRLTGSNLFNASKDELFKTFDNGAD